jgi:hypothetical protein
MFVLSYCVDRSMRMFQKSSNSDLYNCKFVSAARSSNSQNVNRVEYEESPGAM